MDIHIAAVHKNEDYTPRYLMTEQLDSDEPALHMFETYVLALSPWSLCLPNSHSPNHIYQLLS